MSPNANPASYYSIGAAALPAAERGGVAALGNFDGVHKGHQALLAEARRVAGNAAPVLAITFDPHPRRYFMPDAPPFQLDSLAHKAQLLKALGASAVVALRFDPALAELSPQAFVTDILARDLGLRHVVVGYDFTFGKARAGNTALLQSLGAAHGIGLSIVQSQGDGNGAYSSTRIRSLLQAGAPDQAAELLGRYWEVEGLVQRGDQRGRTIGFPTANVDMGDYLVPKLGVYAIRVRLSDGSEREGVANLGLRPTFGKDKVALEAHLFDFQGDLYGQALRVAFIGFIRPERKFAGLDELKAQIAADALKAREILALSPR
ncbi:bifunctional riboflavin kinase/FAD synthetase [Ferrovibrio sp.]|uniref:bifunctional riboflavin kinase/FAD synthetase n=1 Tax=Ferrovibrio sp. TaxID=1917215 RepID=UPI0035B19C14